MGKQSKAVRQRRMRSAEVKLEDERRMNEERRAAGVRAVSLAPDADPTGQHLDPSIPRVAFQGEHGAFSEVAIDRQWPDGAISVPCRTFPDAVARALTHDADFAAIPVENAIAGVVHAAHAALDAAGDMLVHAGEVTIPIHLCLMAPPGATLAGLRVVRSHDIALAQCQEFFAQHDWLDPLPHDDTAGAAREVSARGDIREGAVAAEAAAMRYGLEILARRIEDIPTNWTRFVIVQARASATAHLRELEDRWREADEIAAIADGLFTSVEEEARLAQLHQHKRPRIG